MYRDTLSDSRFPPFSEETMIETGSPIAPPSYHASISKSDTENFAYYSTCIYVGGAGDIALVTQNGDVVTYVGAVAGTQIVGRFKRVNSTNTDATNLVLQHQGEPVV